MHFFYVSFQIDIKWSFFEEINYSFDFSKSCLGARVSGFFYKQLDCEALNEEIIFLAAREKELIVLQEIRMIESRSQQVWANGSGKGDGVEASELHRVKGEIFAARKVFQNKGCM